MKRDYYEILGVPKDADLQAIKKKYRSLALKYHPDRVPAEEKKGAEEKFKEISEAYAVLSDPQKRSMYDQYGHAGIDQRYTAEDIFKGANFEDLGLGDIFSQFFGDSMFDLFSGSASGSRRSSRSQRGHDIQYELEVTLEEAFSGIKKKIKIPRYDFCANCKGSGAKPGITPKTCPTCKGQGQIVMSSGFFRMAQTCSACRGEGKIIAEHCPQCQGQGVVRETRILDVTIPAGVDNDSRLRIKEEGEIGKAGRGDLYLYIRVKPHSLLQREGKDLYMELPVSFVVAALGGEISVAAINEKVTMKVPSGTQSGKVFRLKAKGMPDIHSGTPGDLYVKLMLHVPEHLSAEQRRILEEYARISGEEVDKSGSFADKIKKVFK